MSVPRHVAIIMDGNGRWAEARGQARAKGHEEGARSVKEIVTACRERGVEVLTLYSFSTENWKRPVAEVRALMSLLRRYVESERDDIMNQGIQLRAIGQVERLPVVVRKPLQKLITDSARNSDMVLNLALSYGGRWELVEAAKELARRVASGRLDPEAIDEARLSGVLTTAGLPDPDLMIRTAGEMRISNFLLWQLAYAEIVVTETAWPDFRRPQLDAAFEEFNARVRRYGKTGAQLRREAARG